MIDTITFVDNVSQFLCARDVWNLQLINRSFLNYAPVIYHEKKYKTHLLTVRDYKYIIVDHSYCYIYYGKTFIKCVPLLLTGTFSEKYSKYISYTKICNMLDDRIMCSLYGANEISHIVIYICNSGSVSFDIIINHVTLVSNEWITVTSDIIKYFDLLL